MTDVLWRAAAATLVAWAGGASGAWAGGGARRHLGTLAAGAMGVLLAVTVCDVLPEAWAALSPGVFFLATASGVVLFGAVSRYAAPVCPACALSEFDAPALPSRMVLLLTAALTLHSLMDGVAIAMGDGAGRVNLALLTAVSLHKLPEGLALALLLRASGMGAQAAFVRTAAVEASTLLGGLLGAGALRDASPAVLGAVFAHVGGGFLFLAASMLGLGARRAEGDRARRLLPRPLAWSGGVAFTLTAALLWTLAHQVR